MGCAVSSPPGSGCPWAPAAWPNLSEWGSQPGGFGITASQGHGAVWAGRDPTARPAPSSHHGHVPTEQSRRFLTQTVFVERVLLKGHRNTRGKCENATVFPVFCPCVLCPGNLPSLQSRARGAHSLAFPIRRQSENKERIMRRKTPNQATNKPV